MYFIIIYLLKYQTSFWKISNFILENLFFYLQNFTGFSLTQEDYVPEQKHFPNEIEFLSNVSWISDFQCT